MSEFLAFITLVGFNIVSFISIFIGSICVTREDDCNEYSRQARILMFGFFLAVAFLLGICGHYTSNMVGGLYD